MKKTLQLFSAIGLSALFAVNANAQTTRTTLYEEFTGENCGPCAATNPYITSIADANISPVRKMILLRYQVAIPSAPTSATSLYKQNPTEPVARHGFYNPPADQFAPQARYNGNTIPDGSGNGSDGHAGFITQTMVDNSYNTQDAPFSLNITHTWNATLDSITINYTVTAAQAFTAAAPLKLRLAITEEHISYATAPGTNGEKDFEFIMRKMVPDVNGTALGGTWTNGQVFSGSIKAAMPTYIWNKAEVAIVGFIQEDATAGPGLFVSRPIHQAAYSVPQPIPNDIAAVSVASEVICGTSFDGKFTLKNNGVVNLTAADITYKVDAGANQVYNWTGNVAPGATAVVTLPTQTVAAGTHTLSVTVGNPNGIADAVSGNNTKTSKFYIFAATTMAPLTQAFTAAGIPTGWAVVNPNGGANTWSRANILTGGNGAMKYDAYNNAVEGDIDDLYLPRLDLSGAVSSTMTFDVAHARYDATYVETLNVLASTDCGTTWATLYSKTGSTLATVADQTASAYVPSALTDFRNDAVDLSAYAGMPDVMVKFQVINGYGNQIYVDNVNITTVVGVKESVANFAFTLSPNPANGNVSVNINAVESDNAIITIYNTLGEVVSTVSKQINTGLNNVSIDLSNVANGAYNVVIKNSKGVSTQKLIVNN